MLFRFIFHIDVYNNIQFIGDVKPHNYYSNTLKDAFNVFVIVRWLCKSEIRLLEAGNSIINRHRPIPLSDIASEMVDQKYFETVFYILYNSITRIVFILDSKWLRHAITTDLYGLSWDQFTTLRIHINIEGSDSAQGSSLIFGVLIITNSY